jgi:KaiC/GvpD/RAD55 family RecA-like ATPase
MLVEKVESGIPGFDKLTEGGFVKNSVNLIAGQTGTGKTLFAIQYILHGLRKGENGVYISMEQKIEDILEDVARFGWSEELKRYMQLGKLLMMSQEPTDIKELQDSTFTAIKKINAKRFVLDSLSIATMGWKVSSMDVGKIRSLVYDYMSMLKKIGVTSLLITEIPETETKSLSKLGFEEFLADSVIVLHYLEYAAGGAPRSLIIRKMRRTNHGTDVYPMEITNKGIVVMKT